MNELCYLSIAEADDLIRKRKLSPPELTRAHLERISKLDSRLRSYITVTADLAMREAERAANEIARGRFRGPLHGIPISYKDTIATAGIRTTEGSRIYADWVPEKDAAVVGRLRRAGAVTLGKSTTYEFGWADTTDEDFVKPARNPWDTRLSPGGSSNGSAAGVAAGLAMASVGGDSGGSVRYPASLCGLTGLKPTYGRVGRSGVFPASHSLATVGPLTRSAEDAAILLAALAGHDPGDPASSREAVPQYRRELSRSIKGLKAGVLRSYIEGVGADPEVMAAFETALKVFRSLGMVLRDVEVPHLVYSHAVTWTILRVEEFQTHFKRMRDERDRLGRVFFRTTAIGGFLTAQDYLRAQCARRLIASEMAEAFREVDVLLTPTHTTTASPPAHPIETRRPRVGEEYVTPFNVSGGPAISVPCGINSAGMPAGLQIGGRPFDDGTVLMVAHRYQMETDWHRRRPRL